MEQSKTSTLFDNHDEVLLDSDSSFEVGYFFPQLLDFVMIFAFAVVGFDAPEVVRSRLRLVLVSAVVAGVLVILVFVGVTVLVTVVVVSQAFRQECFQYFLVCRHDFLKKMMKQG